MNEDLGAPSTVTVTLFLEVGFVTFEFNFTIFNDSFGALEMIFVILCVYLLLWVHVNENQRLDHKIDHCRNED